MPSDTAEWNLPNFHVCSIMLSNHIPRVNLSPSSWARQSSLSIDVYTLSLFKSWVKLNGHVYILLLTGGCGWWWRRGCWRALMNACYAWPCKGSRALPYTFMGIKRRRRRRKRPSPLLNRGAYYFLSSREAQDCCKKQQSLMVVEGLLGEETIIILVCHH